VKRLQKAFYNTGYGVSDRTEFISVEEGVMQGDNLGPIIFQTAIVDILMDVHTRFGDVMVISYLDDISLTGDIEPCFSAFQELSQRLLEVGLHVNPDKCSLYCPSGLNSGITMKRTRTDESEEEEEEEAIFTVPDLAARFGFKDVNVSERGITILGAPIGSDDYVTTALQQTYNDIFTTCNNLLAAMRASVDPSIFHGLFKILQLCASAKAIFWLRNVPPTQTGEFASQVDDLITDTMYGLLNQPRPLDKAVRESEQAWMYLPTRLGGTGLQSAERARWAGWIGKSVLAGHYALDLQVRHGSPEDTTDIDPTKLQDFSAALQHLRDAGDGNNEDANSLADALAAGFQPDTKKMQLAVAQILAEIQHKALLERLAKDNPERLAYAKSCLLPGAAAALNAPFSNRGARLSTIPLTILLSKRMGINPYPAEVTHCPMTHSNGRVCGQPLSLFHAEVCPCLHSERSRRHNRLQLHLDDLARICGGIIAPGVPLLQNFFQPKADFKKTSSSLQGDRDIALGPNGRYVLDLSVAAAVQKSLVKAAATEPPGVAARDREAAKVKRLEKHFHVKETLMLVKFVAFVWETSGGAGPEAQRFLRVMQDNYIAGGNNYPAGGSNNYIDEEGEDRCRQATKEARTMRFQRSTEGMSALIHKSVGLSTWLIQQNCKVELARRAAMQDPHIDNRQTEMRRGIGIRPMVAC